MTRVRFANVLLDLDGTLTDPAPGFVRSVKHALEARAARANGLSALGVLWGYGSETELRDAGVDALMTSPEQLLAALLSGTPA